MPFISIITPTHNRATLLPRLFQSLKTQTDKDFEWIVVDDGSTDNTQEVVSSFKVENGDSFPITYIRKENGGKHTALNRGVRAAQGSLIMIADDDDLLPPDAIDIIRHSWVKIEFQASVGGIAGLDVNKRTGEIIGSGLPKEHILCNAMDIRYRYHVTGDLKEVFRTDVLKDFPFPEIAGEMFCPEQLVWFRIAQKYSLYYGEGEGSHQLLAFLVLSSCRHPCAADRASLVWPPTRRMDDAPAGQRHRTTLITTDYRGRSLVAQGPR